MPDRHPRHLWHLAVFGAGVVLAAILFSSDAFRDSIRNLGSMRYFGAFMAGVCYSVSVLSASATVAFYELGAKGNIMILALIGGIGSFLYDQLLYRFTRRTLSDWIARFTHHNLRAMLARRPLLSRLVAIAGFMIIASPLPDEIGVTLVGFTNIRQRTFMALCLLLDTAGVFTILAIGRSFA